MGLSSAGIGSGLDVTSIVSQLMAAAQAPMTTLTSKQSSNKAQMSAYGTLSSGLATFQTTLKTLANASNLQAVTTTPDDSALLSATGGAGAIPGSYAVEVSQLAQAQKLVAAGQNSTQAVIGNGVLTFDFGTTTTAGSTSQTSSFSNSGQPSKSVTIDASNNTLAGIRDAINAANIGITASIVNDGSATPYRLSIANQQTGASNSMRISVGDGAGGTGSSALSSLLSHDPASGPVLTQTMAALNATLTVDGIAVSKPNNTLTDVVPGVSLVLKKTNVGNPTNLTVARDTATVKASVQAFVDGYNKLTASLKSLSSYDQAAKKGAVLNGDSVVRSLKSQMRNVVTGAVSDSTTGYTRLSQIGVELQKDGTLLLNPTKLQTAIDTHFDQLPALFAAKGISSDLQIGYTSSTVKTQPGSYAVSVSQLATQGRWLGQAAVTLPLTISAGSNDSLQVTLDSLSASVTLSPGTYTTAAALAAEVQARINGSTTFSDLGSAVNVSATDGVLSLLSSRYGSGSNVNLSGTAMNALVGGSGSATATTGLDMLGLINGVDALHTGQSLTGAVGNAAEGLKLTLLGGGTGNRGHVQYTQGFAYQLDQLATAVLSNNGVFTSHTDGLTKASKKIDDDILRLNTRLATMQKNYQAQFTKLDTLMSNMNSTSSFLTQQLASLAKSA
jgi:flagellar hook-associated protein 2